MPADPRLTDFARRNRKTATKSEAIMWADLRSRQLGYKFRRQQPIGPYIVDFVCFARKVIVELDGWTHDLEQNDEYDRVRQRWLENHGFTVVRFCDDEVLEDGGAVGDAIFAALHASSPSAPPPIA